MYPIANVAMTEELIHIRSPHAVSIFHLIHHYSVIFLQ